MIFFNVIGTGAIFAIHLLLIFPMLLSWYYAEIRNQIVAGVGLIVLAFFVGLIIQEIATFLDDKWLKIKHHCERRFLILEDIIDNKIKFEQYKKCAKEILEEKGYKDLNLIEEEYNQYVITYATYFIEQYGRSKKIERMQALYGMSKDIMCSMLLVTILFVVKIFCIEVLNFDGSVFGSLTGCLYSGIIAIIFYARSCRCECFKIRMTMGVYSSIVDSERKIKNESKIKQK